MHQARPKIAFVIDDLGFGGAQKQLTILVDALTEYVDPSVYCLSTKNHPFARRIRDRGIPVTEFERRSQLDFGRLGPLHRALVRDRIDLVHGFLDAANIYSFIAARSAGKPIVLSLRNERLRFSGIKAKVLGYALRKADRVVVNSESGLHYLTARIKKGTSAVSLVYGCIRRDKILIWSRSYPSSTSTYYSHCYCLIQPKGVSYRHYPLTYLKLI